MVLQLKVLQHEQVLFGLAVSLTSSPARGGGGGSRLSFIATVSIRLNANCLHGHEVTY